MTNEESKNIVILAAGATVIIIAIVSFSKILKALEGMFGEDESDKAVNAAATAAEKAGYWKEAFIKNPPAGTQLLTMANAKIKADNIYKAIGVVYDKPEQIKAAFSNITTKSQVAFLAWMFKKDYRIDLLEFLRQKLDTDEQQRVLTEILEYTASLPNYYVVTKKK